MKSKLRILSISTMFPNPRMPVHAQFVKQRLDALAKRVDLTLLSPIPWFPGEALVERYRNRHAIPASDPANAYPTLFPKFFSIPALAKPVEGYTLAWRVYRWLKQNGKLNAFDLLDCHLAFPEGFAGAWLKRKLNIPLCITLRGHDVNDLPQYPMRRKQIVHALQNADRFFGVAQALVDAAVALGAPADRGFRSANGVDPQRFHPLPRSEARAQLVLPQDAQLMLSVGHLVVRKGVDILIRSLAELRKRGHTQLQLVVVGKGGEEGNAEPQLRALTAELGLTDAVHFRGAVLNTNLYQYYSAADLFCLASEKEGWPNVVLESLACGTPVVASKTWGIPEIICRPELGVLVENRNSEGITQGIAQALATTWDRDALIAYAARQTWDAVADGLVNHFEAVMQQHQGIDKH